MQTVSETRRARLEMLIEQYGSIAAMNTALGWVRTDPKLALVRNANKRGDRAKPHQMGDAMAREIEQKLSLGLGWMDTPPTYSELHGGSDIRSQVLAVMEDMNETDAYRALAVITALKSTPAKQAETQTEVIHIHEPVEKQPYSAITPSEWKSRMEGGANKGLIQRNPRNKNALAELNKAMKTNRELIVHGMVAGAARTTGRSASKK